MVQACGYTGRKWGQKGYLPQGGPPSPDRVDTGARGAVSVGRIWNTYITIHPTFIDMVSLFSIKFGTPLIIRSQTDIGLRVGNLNFIFAYVK